MGGSCPHQGERQEREFGNFQDSGNATESRQKESQTGSEGGAAEVWEAVLTGEYVDTADTCVLSEPVISNL